MQLLKYSFMLCVKRTKHNATTIWHTSGTLFYVQFLCTSHCQCTVTRLSSCELRVYREQSACIAGDMVVYCGAVPPFTADIVMYQIINLLSSNLGKSVRFIAAFNPMENEKGLLEKERRALFLSVVTSSFADIKAFLSRCRGVASSMLPRNFHAGIATHACQHLKTEASVYADIT